MGCQIVSTVIKGRTHKDGVDDILDCIEYETDLIWDSDCYNKNTILNADNFQKFYKWLFENNFEYQFDRSKYKTFDEWIERELL